MGSLSTGLGLMVVAALKLRGLNKYCLAINDNTKSSEIKALKRAAETKLDSTTECVHFSPYFRMQAKV